MQQQRARRLQIKVSARKLKSLECGGGLFAPGFQMLRRDIRVGVATIRNDWRTEWSFLAIRVIAVEPGVAEKRWKSEFHEFRVVENAGRKSFQPAQFLDEVAHGRLRTRPIVQ